MSDETRSTESMTEKEQSAMWKEAIQKSLDEVRELQERLHPIVFNSLFGQSIAGLTAMCWNKWHFCSVRRNLFRK